MLAAFGGLGIGLVWGWVAVHLLRGARRARALRTLIGLALQVALLRWLGTPTMLASFVAGLLASGMTYWVWQYSLAQRFRED
jgi:NhaP-type Na+/H+ or K+/H+ antiporter